MAAANPFRPPVPTPRCKYCKEALREIRLGGFCFSKPDPAKICPNCDKH